MQSNRRRPASRTGNQPKKLSKARTNTVCFQQYTNLVMFHHHSGNTTRDSETVEERELHPVPQREVPVYHHWIT